MQRKYFVVTRHATGLYPSVYHDELPKHYTDPLVYKLRLDTLPDAAHWCSLTTVELFYHYLQLRQAGKLPADNTTKGSDHAQS